jgi:hypothetical protein
VTAASDYFGAPGVSVVEWGEGSFTFRLLYTSGETGIERKKYGSCRPETENDCAGEGQQNVTAVKHRLENWGPRCRV